MFIDAYSCSASHVHCMQIESLQQQQPHLLVATPGRLLDLIDDEQCPLSLGWSVHSASQPYASVWPARV